MLRSLWLVLAALASTASVAAPAAGLVPTGTLRATFIATNPIQGTVDPKTGEVKGPGPDLARELARRLGMPVKVSPAPGVQGVLASVKTGEADIGFLAYDAGRAVEVDFSKPYAIGQNTFVVPASSPVKSVAELNQPGTVVGATQGDAGELFLSRTWKSATIRRHPGGDMDAALKMLQSGEIAAYGTNRQRLADFAAAHPGYRLLPDNFFGVEQCMIVKKGNAPLLEVVQKFLDEARASGFVANAIRHAGLVGVDVAPAR